MALQWENPKTPWPVRTVVDGYRVHAYGQFDVYEVSPTYDESVVVQQNNSNSWRKIRPRKSWEIKSNMLGLTPTRAPSGHGAEIEPYATAYFIDGNPATVGFAGRPQGEPTTTRAWLRVDFPRPVKIASVVLVSRPDGKGMPADFTVSALDGEFRQTREADERSWQTVVAVEGSVSEHVSRPGNTAPNLYEPQERTDPSGAKRLTYRFDPVTARELWLVSPEDFYLSSFEAHDEAGNNNALLSKGCGATVSGEQYLMWLSEPTQAALWQMYYDLGIKWIRENYYLSPLVPQFVKRKGGYFVDPYLDKLITQTRDCGIEFCLTLPANADPDYARFMVKHFKRRVRYYEVFNEFYNQDSYGPGKQGPVEETSAGYVDMALPIAKAIREVDPSAKIILCGPCPLVADWILACLRKGMARYADVLAWHPYSFSCEGRLTDDDYAPEELDRPRSPWAPPSVKTYADSVEYLRREAAKLGFHGTLMANEAGAYAIHADRTSGLIAAKYLARSAVLHTALGVPMFWNETTSLMSPAWQQVFSPTAPVLKPAYSYFVMRTLCTVLDEAKPDSIAFGPTRPVEKLERYAFCLSSGNKLLALWMREKSRKNRLDDYEGVVMDVQISSRQPRRAIGIDLLNGREQELRFAEKDGRVVAPGLLVKDYPLLVRLEY